MPESNDRPTFLDHAEAFANEAENTVETDPEYGSAQALASIAFSLLVIAKHLDSR
jgi:hypothetical protein